MHRDRGHDHKGWTAQDRFRAVQMCLDRTSPDDQDLVQVSVAVCADFPVMQTAARGDGLHVNRSCIGGTERFAVKKKGRNGPPVG
jgi:hypothetical protein